MEGLILDELPVVFGPPLADRECLTLDDEEAEVDTNVVKE